MSDVDFSFKTMEQEFADGRRAMKLLAWLPPHMGWAEPWQGHGKQWEAARRNLLGLDSGSEGDTG